MWFMLLATKFCTSTVCVALCCILVFIGVFPVVRVCILYMHTFEVQTHTETLLVLKLFNLLLFHPKNAIELFNDGAEKKNISILEKFAASGVREMYSLWLHLNSCLRCFNKSLY